jgi:hypothetical protein
VGAVCAAHCFHPSLVLPPPKRPQQRNSTL